MGTWRDKNPALRRSDKSFVLYKPNHYTHIGAKLLRNFNCRLIEEIFDLETYLGTL